MKPNFHKLLYIKYGKTKRKFSKYLRVKFDDFSLAISQIKIYGSKPTFLELEDVNK